MKKTIYFVMMATVAIMMASCHSKEKEETAFAKVEKSTDTNELRAYIDLYYDDAPAEHIAKIRSNLKALVADSTAFANITKSNNLKEKVALEVEYLEKFESGQHKVSVDSMFEKDQKALKEKAENAERANRFENFSIYFENNVYSTSPDILRGYIFGKPNSKGKGNGAFVDEYSGIVEKFRYQISEVFDEVEIFPKNGGESRTVRLLDGGISVDEECFPQEYNSQKYKSAKKYI